MCSVCPIHVVRVSSEAACGWCTRAPSWRVMTDNLGMHKADRTRLVEEGGPVALDPVHARQIAQFMLIAETYLDLSSPASAETRETLGMTKYAFMPGSALDPRTRALAILGAHISSAAIRLASVENVLERAGESMPHYRACRDYFNGDGPDNLNGRTCSRWFHVMLRNNAAHEEPSRTHLGVREQRRRERQDCIEMTTFSEAHSKIRAIANELQSLVTTTYGIAPP
jgi:hypothetical protein